MSYYTEIVDILFHVSQTGQANIDSTMQLIKNYDTSVLCSIFMKLALLCSSVCKQVWHLSWKSNVTGKPMSVATWQHFYVFHVFIIEYMHNKTLLWSCGCFSKENGKWSICLVTWWKHYIYNLLDRVSHSGCLIMLIHVLCVAFKFKCD